MSTLAHARTLALFMSIAVSSAAIAQRPGGRADADALGTSRLLDADASRRHAPTAADAQTSYIVRGVDLLAIDTRDPARPRIVARAELALAADRLERFGDLLVATDSIARVQVFTTPRLHELRTGGVVRTLAAPLGFARSGALLLIAEGERGVEIVDVSDPGAPLSRAVLRLGGRADAIRIQRDLAAVTCSDQAGMRTVMVSIADPSRPTVVGISNVPDARRDPAAFSASRSKPPIPVDGFDGGDGSAPSIIRQVLWDGKVLSTNLDVRFDRADETIADDGVLIPAGMPRFGVRRLLCPAPAPVARRTTDVRVTRVWSGRWQDLSDCMVECWTNEDWSVQTIGICVDGVYPPDPIRSKSVGSPGAPSLFLGDTPDPDPGWKHAPVSFLVADGCVLAFCVALDATDSDSQKSMSVCYWDENIAGPDHGELKWKLHGQRGPQVQPGQSRGAGWVSSGPWVPPGGVDPASGKLLQFFVTLADYRANPGSSGGQLFLMRCHRPSVDQKWTLDPLVLLYADEPGGELVPIPGQSSFMHFHCAAVTFPGAGVEGRSMVVTLSVGDGWPNNRLVNLSRDDFLNYADNADSDQGPRARTPTEGTFPPDTPIWNGWTTYEDRAGQRARVTFGRDENQMYVAQYRDSPDQIYAVTVPEAFAGYQQPPGVTPVYITGGGSGVFGVGPSGIVGKQDSQTLLLNRRVASASPTPISGAVWSDTSIQPVCMAPTADPRAFLAGGDEHSDWMYRIGIANPASPIAIRRVAGTPTHAAAGFNGAGICLNWLCLFVGARPGVSSSAMSEYLALVCPSSIGSWAVEGAAQTLFYSPDGISWGELFATNYTEFDRAMQSAFFRQREGDTLTDRVFVGRDDWCGLWAIHTPSPATTVLARPIRISPGGVNDLREPLDCNGVLSAEIIDGPQGQNACFPVRASSLGARGEYVDVPGPPSEGPIMRCQFVDSHRMGTWRIGADICAASPPVAKGRIWIYRLPASTSGDPNEFPVNASAKISVFAAVVRAGQPVPEVCLLQGPLLGGTGSRREAARNDPTASGWTPFTFEVPAGDSCGPDTYALEIKIVSSNNCFNRQDVLVALDFVGYAGVDGTVELPARPMKPAPGAVALDEKLELRFVPPRPISAGASPEPWTVLTALTLPPDGPDAKTLHRVPDAGLLTLFTLWESPRTYLRVCFDRQRGVMRFVDHLGHAWEFGGPAEGDDNIPFAQPFLALRGRQMLLGLARFDAGGGASGYRAWVSMGGTRITYGVTSSLAGVIPGRIRLGDQNQEHTDPADYFGFYVDEGRAMEEGEGRVMLETLGFLK